MRCLNLLRYVWRVDSDLVINDTISVWIGVGQKRTYISALYSM